MSRKPTPVNVLDELLPAQSETSVIRQALRWDYSQAGDAADEVRGHAIEIKRGERRASEAIVEAGRHLIAVKGLLPHGSWEDWLSTEFSMTDRTAQRMMSVTRQFDGETDTVSLLGPSVLYLLAGDSVPEPAREAVIDMAKSGETVTKAKAQEVIEQHKPKPEVPLRMAATTPERERATWGDLTAIVREVAEANKPYVALMRQAADMRSTHQKNKFYYDVLNVVRGRYYNRFDLADMCMAISTIADQMEAAHPAVERSQTVVAEYHAEELDPWVRAYRSFGPARLAQLMVDWAHAWTDDKGRTWRDVAARNPQHANSPFYQNLAAECGRRGVMFTPGQLAITIAHLFTLLLEADRESGVDPDVTIDDDDDDAAFAAAPLPKAVPVAEPVRVVSDREAELQKWWIRLISMKSDLSNWGDLTGHYLDTGECERGLRKMLQITERELSLLRGEVVESEGWAE